MYAEDGSRKFTIRRIDPVQFKPLSFQQQERRPISSKRVATSDLKPDLSNLGDITLAKLREALQGSQSEQIIQRAIEELQEIARQGTGVVAKLPSSPLHQSGLECQTMALLNGIQTWEGFDRVRDLIPQIPEIRGRAMAARHGDRKGIYSMLATGEVFNEMGLLHAVSAVNRPSNPIQAARQLFVDHRFLGVGSDEHFHAYAVLPLQYTSDSQEFALKVDSSGGRVDTLSVKGFLDIILERPYTENQVIYQVEKK